MSKIALLTSTTGQDSYYLTHFLLNKGYDVHGIIHKMHDNTKPETQLNPGGLNFSRDSERITYHFGDLTDSFSIFQIINQIKPDEIYNLGAQSHVGMSFSVPEYTSNVNALGALRILEAVRILNLVNKTKIYQASSAEIFDNSQSPQNEKTSFYPQSPYAISKLFAYWMVINYREAYHLYACNGILFNHESPLRADSFVTRKITQGLAHIKLSLQDCLQLGNIDVQRDWGHAQDYVEMQWLILQQEIPDDYVIATGEAHSIKEFIIEAAAQLDLTLTWEGSGINTKAYDEKGICRIKIDPSLFRPIDRQGSIGDASKAQKILGWQPKISFKNLVKEMVLFDLALAKEHARNNFISPL